jgi:hypothetical protein
VPKYLQKTATIQNSRLKVQNSTHPISVGDKVIINENEITSKRV